MFNAPAADQGTVGLVTKKSSSLSARVLKTRGRDASLATPTPPRCPRVSTVHTRLRVSSVLMAVVLAALGLTGCDENKTLGTSTPKSASPSATTSGPAGATAVAANILQLCDHAQDAFRSGGLDDAAQNAALAAELQGMMDVADPDAAQVLRPMSEAAAAIAADGRAKAEPALQKAEEQAYRALRRACISAGSQAWS